MKRKRASADNPSIDAIINRLYRFNTKAQAKHLLTKLGQIFEAAKDESQEEAITIWIKKYQLTDAEIKAGYKGNYAKISIFKTEDSFSLKADKLEKELKYHPEKKVSKGFISFGHYILRKIKKGHIYENLQEAQIDLAKIHKEFPTTTIPAKDKLLIIAFVKKAPKKYILRPIPNGSGKYTVSITENLEKPKVKKEEKPSLGQYTELVNSRKK